MATIGKSTAVILGDSHAGFEDRSAHSIAEQVIRKVKPEYLIHLGDLMDAYSISRFDKDPTRLDTLQSEINVGRNILARLSAASPNSKKYLLAGNHENRLQRLICNLDGPARELARLDSFQEAMTWQSLLKLSISGWRFIPEAKQPLAGIIPGLVLKHGSVVRRYAGYSAKGEFDSLHCSGISGHTHRQAIYNHDDFNGSHVWIENGCLCRLDAEYMSGPANWQQGFTVLTWSADKSVPLQIEQVRIDKGKALFRDALYTGATK
jgi:predicted phosphodiesterase